MLSSNDHAIDYHLSLQADGAVLLQFRGELDLASASVAEAALRQATREPPLLVLDLRAVTFMDSAGVLVVFRAYQEQRAAGKGLRILLLPGHSVHRVLTTIGLTSLPGIEWETVSER